MAARRRAADGSGESYAGTAWDYGLEMAAYAGQAYAGHAYAGHAYASG